MINENNEVKISTDEGFEIIKVITKMGMKQTIVDAMKNIMKLEERKNKETIKLRTEMIKKVGNDRYRELTEEEKVLLSDEVLAEENNKIGENLTNVNSETAALYLDLIFEFVSKIPNAKKELYKTLSEIFEKDVKEIEKQAVEETIEMLKQIANSSTFKSLFAFFK